MNLLFDFITVRTKNGAAEYTRRVFFELWKKIQEEHLSVDLFALYDSRNGIAYEDMREECFKGCVKFVDAIKGIDVVCQENMIDRFFIGSAQGLIEYPEIENLTCDVVCVVHDLFREETFHNKMEVVYRLLADDAEAFENNMTFKDRIKLKNFLGFPKYDKFSFWYVSTGGNSQYRNSLRYMRRYVNLYNKNKRFQWITVSEYSKSSIVYNLGIPENEIKVLYSPARIMEENGQIENSMLIGLLNSHKKYYLMVSANRPSKNAIKAIKAFKRYAEFHTEAYLVTIGYETKKFANHICMPFLKECDLNAAYKNCHALIFPSLFEGFGYPPIEAMRYGKPVLCSNATSMPEIFGDAPIYFSPLYETGIFDALCRLENSNYSDYAEKAIVTYNRINERQERDLDKMISMLIEM